jgi:ABC-type branched-subunit amino acid transport system substrate-binding protein
MQVDSTISKASIDSLYRIHQEMERGKLEETNTKLDSADIPVTSFDGLLVPIYKDDLGLIAPQIAYANFETQILGNSDWYSMEGLKKNKNYINGIVFITDGYLNEEDWDYRQFRNNFRNRFKRTPEKFELIGYDSFNFLLSIFNKGNSDINRGNFADKVLSLQSFRGIYRSFDLTQRSSNNAARILKYYYGQLIPLN